MALVVFFRYRSHQVQSEITLTISDLVYPGKGLARVDGFVVFVGGVLPGETVRASICKRHKNYAEAELIEVLEESPDRKDAACPLFRICPGCCYQHVDYAYEIAAKQKQFIELLTRLGRVDPNSILGPIASPIYLGYRNKIILHADLSQKAAVLGYIGYDNIPPTDCLQTEVYIFRDLQFEIVMYTIPIIIVKTDRTILSSKRSIDIQVNGTCI